MKRIFLLITSLLLLTGVAFADSYKAPKTGNDPFAIKAQYLMGFYIDQHTNLKNHHPSAPTGIILGVEFPSLQQRPWQQYLQNPTVGLGMTYLNFGDKGLGHAVALYPYILLNCVRTEHFEMKVKLAAGLGVVNEHWYTQECQNTDHYYEGCTNAIFGCYLNAYLNAGLNLTFPITRNFAINGEFGFIHMSNGRTVMPNVGANIMYGSVGMIASINSDEENQRKPIQFPSLPYKWSLNITAAGGAQKADITDKAPFAIASLHAGAIYNVCNWYGVGAGVDVFFNDAISKNTTRSLFSTDPRINYTFTDKLRVGVGINNEFQFGMLTAILDWGVYLYNPSRNYYSHYVNEYCKEELKTRPLFYKSSGPGSEEAFHYFRFGLKCRVWDNIYLQATAKTHLQICEYVEFGIGYQIPFLSKRHRSDNESIIFHQKYNWWKK